MLSSRLSLTFGGQGEEHQCSWSSFHPCHLWHHGLILCCVLLPANRNPIVLPRSLLGQNNPQLRTHIKPKEDFCFEVSRIHSDLNGSNLTSQILEIRLSLIRWPLAPIASRQIGGEVDSLRFGLLLLLLLLHVLASFAAGLKVHSWLGFKSSKSHICRFRSKSLACKLSPRGSFIFMQCNALQCFNNVSQ